MITVEQAYELIAQHVGPLGPAVVPLGEALGLRLAESVVSDIDSPPFDKSLLDGYAIDVGDPSPTRKIVEQVLAGEVPRHSIELGNTVRVMTGAPIPKGANAVVKHEDTVLLDEHTLRLPAGVIREGGGVFRRGESFHQGQELLPAGKRLTSVDIAVLAEVGKSSVTVGPRPKVSVLSTGDELVDCREQPGPGQIRNSNGPMLMAAVAEAQAKPVDLGTVRDDADSLRTAISRGFESDVLLITGGVSAGVMDLVPGVLADLGVKPLFHKVRMKPGKPLWFGRRDAAGRRTLVFGLPGNPVSTLVSFTLFVKPTVAALAGMEFSQPATTRGQLADGTKHRGDRPTYHPCRLQQSPLGYEAIEPLPWRGSADLAALTRANALMVLPAGDYELTVGTPVDALVL